jgi:hypothetical protein
MHAQAHLGIFAQFGLHLALVRSRCKANAAHPRARRPTTRVNVDGIGDFFAVFLIGTAQ